MRSLIYIVLMLVAAACGFSSSQPLALDDAQSLMQTDPVAALSKLNGIDVSEFEDSATLARWALLYTEAMAANKLTAPTDTIVNFAIEYYASHNRDDEYQRASTLKAAMRRLADGSDALATALYLQKEKEFMLYRERAKRQLHTAIAMICLLLAIGVIAWMRWRIRLQALQRDALMAEASGLKCQIVASRADVDRLQSKLHGLLEKRFALIDSLCQTYYESQGTKTERKAIIDKVKSEIEAVRADSFADMEQAVNDCCDNVLIRVKECYPDIKPDDYRLLVYLAGGLSTRAISLLLGESVEVIYKRKSRLKSRLAPLAAGQIPTLKAIF